MKNQCLSVSVLALFLIGCSGGSSSSSSSSNSDPKDAPKSVRNLPYTEEMPEIPKDIQNKSLIEKATGWFSYIKSVPGKFITSLDSLKGIVKSSAAAFGFDSMMTTFLVDSVVKNVQENVQSKKDQLVDKATSALADGSAVSYGTQVINYLKSKGNSIFAFAQQYLPSSTPGTTAPALGMDMSDVSTRGSRMLSGMDTSSFSFNGQSGLFYAMKAPVMMQLDGDEQDFTGVASTRVGSTVLGVIHSHGRVNESSALVSCSVKDIFLEGQVGAIEEGYRTSLKLGVDTAFASPFVQLAQRKSGEVSETRAVIGVEAAQLTFKTDSGHISNNIVLKGGIVDWGNSFGTLSFNSTAKLSEVVSLRCNLDVGSLPKAQVSLGISY